MGIFIDPPRPSPRAVNRGFRKGQLFVHLTADSQEELLKYAKRINLPERWLQKKDTPRFHFDVTGRWLKMLFDDERVETLGAAKFVERVRRRRTSDD